MNQLISIITNSPIQNRFDGGDCTSDRLSSAYTIKMLLGFAGFVQFSQIFGDPVECWCPAHFTGTHSAYTNKACWVQNTYYLPDNENIPRPGQDRQYISYYPWVGLALSCQAVCFFMPKAVWRTLCSFSGYSVSQMVDAAIRCDMTTSTEETEKQMNYIIAHLHDCFQQQQGKRRKKFSWFLPIAYLFVKILYIANVVLQFILMNHFLYTGYSTLGFDILKKLSSGESLTDPTRFPRVTLCDFTIRLLGNVHRYTVQCSLPMNLFNEIIFIFVWFWFVFVAAVAVSSLLYHLYSMAPSIHKKHIKRMLNTDDEQSDSKRVNDFVRNLSGDGRFILKMIRFNASGYLATKIISKLFQKYKDAMSTETETLNHITSGRESKPLITDS